jgi:hypothetical protein
MLIVDVTSSFIEIEGTNISSKYSIDVVALDKSTFWPVLGDCNSKRLYLRP